MKMSKVTLNLNVSTALSIKQILEDHQKGYTNNPNSVPPRIFEIREVITDITDAINNLSE